MAAFGSRHVSAIFVGAEIAQQRKSALAQEDGQFLGQHAKSSGFAEVVDLGDDSLQLAWDDSIDIARFASTLRIMIDPQAV